MPKIPFFIVFIILLLLVFTGSCRRQPGSQAKLVITGSSTIAPLVNEIGKRFETVYPGTRIDVQTGGSSRGLSDVRQGLADIGMVSRDPNHDEDDLHWFALAKDGISLIVHKDNGVDSLNDSQIVSIYRGKITNWKELGGDDAPITVVNKAEGRSTLEVFLKYFHLDPTDIKAHVIIGDNQQGIKTVIGNPNAIAYVSIGTAEFEVQQGTSIKLLTSSGVAASIENVRNGTYPISRTLNLVTKHTITGIVKEFVEFCQFEQVGDLVEEQFFVQIRK